MKIWTSGPYRPLAVDGTEVHRPTEVSGRSVPSYRGRPSRSGGEGAP